MQKILNILVSFTLAGVTESQTISPATINPAPTQWVAAPSDGFSTIWKRTAYEQASDGSIVPQCQEYVEIGSGLNHLVNGQWLASSENIVLSADATTALATNGQHWVSWPGNISGGTSR